MENFTFSPSFYRILCVGPNASKEEIKKAFRGLLKVYHPDKNPDSLEWANEQTRILNLAYEILMNDEKRANYDKLLKQYELEIERKRQAEELKKKQAEERKRKANNTQNRQTPKQQPTYSKAEPDISEGVGFALGFAALALLLVALSGKGK